MLPFKFWILQNWTRKSCFGFGRLDLLCDRRRDLLKVEPTLLGIIASLLLDNLRYRWVLYLHHHRYLLTNGQRLRKWFIWYMGLDVHFSSSFCSLWDGHLLLCFTSDAWWRTWSKEENIKRGRSRTSRRQSLSVEPSLKQQQCSWVLKIARKRYGRINSFVHQRRGQWPQKVHVKLACKSRTYRRSAWYQRPRRSELRHLLRQT